MRNHAVSTRDMRSRAAACIVSSAGLRPVAKGVPKMLGNIGGVNRDFHPTTQRRPVMADLKAQFEQAVAESKSLPEKPDNMTLLKLYALYKQASSGDAEGKRPGFGDMVGRAKWDAWNGLKGKSGDEAMQEYVDLIESLKSPARRTAAAPLLLRSGVLATEDAARGLHAAEDDRAGDDADQAVEQQR